jgi:transposase
VGHRRHVHSGTVCKSATGSSCGGAESARSGAGVRAGTQDGAEDAGVSGSARRPKLGPWQAAIDAILEEDKSRPRRQRHTAKRICERLREEHGYAGGYTIVKDYVRQSKIGAREMFVPLSHAPGEAQADFGEALVVIAGLECEAHYLAFDLPHSDDCFVVAFPAETTEAFLEGHVRAFAYFAGVPTRILYDNTTLAVARILGDGERLKTRAFSELQSHYLFAEKFGRPAKGNDKGKVEGLVGYARRNFMVPIPRAASWEELNLHLEAACLKRRQRRMRGHRETITERFERDRAALLPLPAVPYEACEKISTRLIAGALSIQRLLRAHRVRTPAGAGEGLCASGGDCLRERSHRPTRAQL